ncbi:MAG: hypothetical protein U5N86_10885 [Planctomycetota bacterium]|nr:hypothetical protein [Planctomycetota bacterium]
MKKGLFPALVALVVLCAIAAAVYIAIQIQPEPEPVVAGMTTEEFIAATSYVYRGEDMKSKGDGRFVELYSGSRGEGSEKHSRKTGMLRELEAKESSDHIGALGVGGAGEPAGGYAKAKGGRIMDESSTIAGDNIAADSHILTAGSYDDTETSPPTSSFSKDFSIREMKNISVPSTATF